MESRSWRWFASSVEGLLSRPPACFVQTADPQDSNKSVNRAVYSTRLQQHFFAQEG